MFCSATRASQGSSSSLPSMDAAASKVVTIGRPSTPGADKDDFTADGKPNLVKLKAKAGFAVTREEADAAFAELTAKG